LRLFAPHATPQAADNLPFAEARTVSEESAFLAAVAATPDDDTARLVYADWLGDRSDPRGEYVRLEVRRNSFGPRKKKQRDDLYYPLDNLRRHATPDWLSLIDRVGRFSFYWSAEACHNVARDAEVGHPLARLDARNTHVPRTLEQGDYVYVLAYRERTLYVVARMRFERASEHRRGDRYHFSTAIDTLEGTEGTPVAFDREVPPPAMRRFGWYSSKIEVHARLDLDDRLTSAASVVGMLRLTPRTAIDLDTILRGEAVRESV
jgi:uncharacterized protein (TIGR02996 family)